MQPGGKAFAGGFQFEFTFKSIFKKQKENKCSISVVEGRRSIPNILKFLDGVEKGYLLRSN